MDRTGYTRGDVANQYGVPVRTDARAKALGWDRGPDSLGAPIACPEGCRVPEGESRDEGHCAVCSMCGLVTRSRILACYPKQRVREILAQALLIEVNTAE